MKLEIKNRAELWAACEKHGHLMLDGLLRMRCRWDSDRGPQLRRCRQAEQWAAHMIDLAMGYKRVVPQRCERMKP